MGWFRPAAVLLLLILTTPVGAQLAISPGTRIRVRAADSATSQPGDAARGWVIGTVVANPPPALVLAAGPVRVSYDMNEVRQVDVSRGRPNRRWRGAILGGLLSGAAFTGAVCAFSSGSCDISEDVGGFLAYYVIGAIPGAIIGGAIGARHVGKERWERVWPPGP